VDSAPKLSEDALRDEIERLAPWHHAVDLPYGLRTGSDRRRVDETRVEELKHYAWPALLEACGGTLKGRRVLDIACNCGGFSVEAARSGADYVLGVDIVPRYIEQARLLSRALELPQLDFKVMSLDEIEGEFDVVLNFGLIYHLENPVASMRRVAAATTEVMIVETALHTTKTDTAFWRMDLLDPVTPDERVATTGLWRSSRICQLFPNRKAVEDLLGFFGFDVRYLEPPPELERPEYHDGRRAVFVATRSGSAVPGA